MVWNDDDSGFYSGSADGNMYLWNIQDNTNREDDYVNNQKPIIQSIAKVPEMNTCYLVGNKKVIETDNQSFKSDFEIGLSLS